MASRKLKKGGSAKMNVYNAKGAPEEHEAMDEEPGFRKGGRAHKKHGGKLEGGKSEMRADKKARGHHKRAAGGRTPYSSGSKMMGEADSTPGEGHEGTRPEGG